MRFEIIKEVSFIQARIAQLVAYQLGTGEIQGSYPGKGENFSMKIKTGVDAVHESCPQRSNM